MITLFMLAVLAVVGMSIAAVLGLVFFLLKILFWVVFFPIRLILKLLWIPVGLTLGAVGLAIGAVALPLFCWSVPSSPLSSSFCRSCPLSCSRSCSGLSSPAAARPRLITWRYNAPMKRLRLSVSRKP